MAVLQMRDVVKKYDNITAIERLDFKVADGELLVLLGRPGAGKTTTLKIAAGLEPVTTGQVFIGGQDVTQLPAEERNVAMVFETYALYPHLSVFDNISFCFKAPARSVKVDKAEINRRVQALAEMLEISDLLDRKPRELSGGQRQRVAVARALVRAPNLNLMDEPIAHLDARLRHGLRPDLRNFLKERGVTTLYATTDYIEALGMADRVLILSDGQVVQIGTRQEILNRPASEKVGELIGIPPMNMIRNAKPVTAAGGMVLEADGCRIPIQAQQQNQIEKKNATTLNIGIYPSEIELIQADDPKKPSLIGQVYVYEPLGTKGSLSVKIGNEVLKVQTSARVPKAAAGEPVNLYIDESKVHVFDSMDGSNILSG